MGTRIRASEPLGETAQIGEASATRIIPTHSDGVTTGLDEPTRARIRSMVDRLGKAARKGTQGDLAVAWMMVGRVQAELMALLEDR